MTAAYPEMSESRRIRVLVVLIGLNCTALVASVAGGAKVVQLPLGMSAAATVLSYALTFAFTDVISEVFGPRLARFAVRLGFASMLLTVLFLQLCIHAPAAAGWEWQDAYATVLGTGPRLVLGGWLAYLVSQHLDVHVFHRLGRMTRGRHLWLRNNVSTMLSQAVDTAIFVPIAFGGLYPLAPLLLGQYMVKLLIAAMDTLPVYLGVGWARRALEAQPSWKIC